MKKDYIAGFFDGEGSLIIRFKKDLRYLNGFQIKPNIDIAQKNLQVLKNIKNKLKIGKLYLNKKEGVWHYNIFKFKDLSKFVKIIKRRVVVKKEKLERFEKCINMLVKKEHLTPSGFNNFKKIWLNRESEANTP